MGRIVIGVTGASGAIYADRLVTHLKNLGEEVHLVLTDMGKKVCAFEGFPNLAAKADRVYDNGDFFAPISSGTGAVKSVKWRFSPGMPEASSVALLAGVSNCRAER